MKKKRAIRLLCKLPSWTALLLLCASCATTKPAQQASRDFYREYSKKLGIPLQGNEHKELIRVSAQWLRTPYKYGGQSKSGVDCSAFVGIVYKEALGITLPRSSSAIAKSATSVQRSNLHCGDIVFFTNKEKRISHVGIYLSNGNFVHASTSSGVAVASLNNSYWKSYYAGAGRIKSAANKLIQAQPQQQQKASDTKKVEEVKQPKVEKTETANKTNDVKKPEPNNDLIIVFDEEF